MIKIILIFLFFLCANAKAEFYFFLDSQSLDLKAGLFTQEGGRLLSGGLFYVPSFKFFQHDKHQAFLDMEGGLWFLKDPGGTPAPTPSFHVGPRYQSPFFDLNIRPFAGFSYAFVFDRGFLVYGARIAKDWTNESFFLGIDSIGLQYIYLDANVSAHFIGADVAWRF